MKSYIKLITCLLLLFISKSFSQVTTQIMDVTINSQSTVNNCGLIDLGTITNNSLSVYFKLTKPSSQAIGTCTVRAYLKYSSASYGAERGTYTVLNTAWSNSDTETYGTMAFNISASEIQVTGSSIFIECTTDSGLKSSSCEYPLKKTASPSFTLSPTSLSLSCGDTSSKIFTVTSANIPSGATLNY
jgi:hypothetical protein